LAKEECREDGCPSLRELEASVDRRHAENRLDIKRIESTGQATLRRVIEMEMKLTPWFGAGRPGLLEKMGDTLVEIQIDLAKRSGEQRGQKTEKKSVMDVLEKMVMPLAVALLVSVLAHYWH
jgi:hypothetical protein